MNTKWMIIISLLFVLFLSGCKPDTKPLEIHDGDAITMENLDLYMLRDDVQYVDLRNFNSKFMSGYIDGFEQIPFFEYLDYRVFDRNGGYDFTTDQLLKSAELERLFDRDKAIFLFADGCIRSEYIKDALESLGYDKIFVLGGFYEYKGEFLELGTGDYIFGNTFYSTYTSETTSITYYVYGTFDVAKNILSIRFDMVDSENKTMRSTNYDSIIDYNTELTILENKIVSDMLNFEQLYDEITHLESSSYDQISGYSLGFDNDFISLFETLIRN